VQASQDRRKLGEFVNTWSVNGFVSEGSQPAELGWGTHERALPFDAGTHKDPLAPGIFLNRCGAATKVRSWTPLAGPYHGYLITHNEALSIADYLTVKDGSEVVYRPTVHYAYQPCDDAVLSLHELAATEFAGAYTERLISEDIVSGIDELGVLLMGHRKNAYWCERR
jgi:homospermidine synthase